MNGESKKKEQLRLRRLIYGTFSINEVTQLLPDGGNKIIDIEIVYRPGVWFRKFAGNNSYGSLYTSEALRGCLKSRLVVRKLTKLRICSTQHRESVMSKAYPSNLTRAHELLSEMIPKAKPGGRPREVDMWEILNAIFYVLVEGVRWRSTRRFSGLANGIHLLRTWRKDETWLQLHDRLRDWTRIEQERHRSPSAIVDSQSIKRRW